MDWIKVSEKLPEFNKPLVLLYKVEDKKYAYETGYLQAITADGPIFNINSCNSLDDILGSFFGSASTRLKENNIPRKYTHYCIIEITDIQE